MNLKKNLLVVFLFSFFILNYSFVNAGFTEYTNSIKKASAEESRKQACTNSCPTDQKYYQLTTGLPFLDANATKCSCVPVSMGMNVFLPGILKFILGSVGTITVIIIIVAGFMWSFSAGNKNKVKDAKAMISNAVIGLVLTLTSGLMLQVVNPKLLTNNSLIIDTINIKEGEKKTSKSIREGEWCKVGFTETTCSAGLFCAPLNKCNNILSKYSTLNIGKYSDIDGMCIVEGKTLSCLDESCNNNTVCMNIIKQGNVSNSTYCSNGKCIFPSGEIDTSKTKVGLNALCGDSASGAACQDIYTCLNSEFRSDSGNQYRCYPLSCRTVINKGNMDYHCNNNDMCCEAWSTCNNDNYCK